MNERIRELFLEADFPKVDIEREAERFAELIVKECEQAVLAHMLDGKLVHNNAVLGCANRIKQHFGIK